MTARVRVELPSGLQALARAPAEIALHVPEDATQRLLLEAIETAWPALRGTLRDHATGARRPFIRFFACGADISHDGLDTPLPAAIVAGAEPFLVVGAISGG